MAVFQICFCIDYTTEEGRRINWLKFNPFPGREVFCFRFVFFIQTQHSIDNAPSCGCDIDLKFQICY